MRIFTYRFFIVILLITSLSFQGWTQRKKVIPYLPQIMDQYPVVRDFALSPDGNYCYFSAGSPKHEFTTILYMQKNKAGWSAPKLAPFAGQYRDIEPAFSPDGLKLFFSSNRPKSDTTVRPGDYDIWYVERKTIDDKWSAPINPGAPLNTTANEFYPSITQKGDVYFTAQYEEQTKGKEDIYVCRQSEDGYLAPISLPVEVNTETWEYNAFVSPDESYIIFSSYGRSDDMGGSDLYISFKGNDNRWEPAIHMGPDINSKQIDYCPFVDASGNLYFTSERSDVPMFFHERQNLDDILKAINNTPNGTSRLYVVNIDELIH